MLEILRYSYNEHFKAAKDLALIFPVGHARRIELDVAMKELIDKINAIIENP